MEETRGRLAVVIVSGGIGSQLTQYAFGLFCRKALGAEVKYDITWFDTCGKDCDNKCNRNFVLLRLWPDLDFAVATEEEIAFARAGNLYVNENSYKFCFDLFRLKFPMYIGGYHESVAYIDAVRDEVLREAYFSKCPLDAANEAVLAEIRGAGHSCAVHVRRGDFVSLGLAVLGPDYYSGAIGIVEKMAAGRHVKFFFFSNDCDYVRDQIIPKCRKGLDFRVVDVNSNDTGHCDLQLMSQCTDQISPNSSFGFWGAYLNANANKVVVLPSCWGGVDGRLARHAAAAHYMPGAVMLDVHGKRDVAFERTVAAMHSISVVDRKDWLSILSYAFVTARLSVWDRRFAFAKKRFWKSFLETVRGLVLMRRCNVCENNQGGISRE